MLYRFPLNEELGHDVLRQTVHDEVVLPKLNSQQYFGLDEVGAHAWNLLAENADFSAVTARLCERYDGDPATIRSDFHAPVAELIEAGPLKVVHV